jgi:hypothetical protein
MWHKRTLTPVGKIINRKSEIGNRKEEGGNAGKWYWSLVNGNRYLWFSYIMIVVSWIRTAGSHQRESVLPCVNMNFLSLKSCF